MKTIVVEFVIQKVKVTGTSYPLIYKIDVKDTDNFAHVEEKILRLEVDLMETLPSTELIHLAQVRILPG